MERIWGVSLQAKMLYITHQKIESSCPLVIEHILEKKVSLIAFRQILSKILPEASILHNHDLFEKACWN